MELKEFINNNDVDYTKNVVDSSFIEEIEHIFDFKIGPQLKDYILNYGYLGYKHIELFGINSEQKYKSDMIEVSNSIHHRFSQTSKFLAIGGDGEVGYFLVDGNDQVYELNPVNGNIEPLNMSMYDYILKIFIESKM